jgi:hypothetical protein
MIKIFIYQVLEGIKEIMKIMIKKYPFFMNKECTKVTGNIIHIMLKSG